MSKTCDKCKYGLFKDYGYSNYTVEGTTFSCLKNVHPKGDFDRWYGENPDLDYAQECQSYVIGEALEIDVDHEIVGYPPDWTRLTQDNDVLPLLLLWVKKYN